MAVVTNADGSRYYTWPSPDRKTTQRFWSVTTILDAVAKQNVLVPWAVRMTAEFALDNIGLLLEILNRAVVVWKTPLSMEEIERYAVDGTLDPEQMQRLIELHQEMEVDDPEGYEARWDECYALLEGARKRYTNRAALKGSDVHDAIEAYHLGKPWPPVPRRAQAAYEQLVKIFRIHKPTIEVSEASVYNREKRYAGRFDAIGVWPTLGEVKWPEKHPLAGQLIWPGPWKAEEGPRLLVDVKTGKGGKKGAYPEAALQMSAYARAEFIAGPEGSEFSMPEVDGAAVLHVTDEKAEIIPVDIGDGVFMHFLWYRECFRWMEEVSKGVIGKPIPVHEVPEEPEAPEEAAGLASEPSEGEKVAV